MEQLGEQFLNSWVTNKEYVIDYYEEFQNELSEKFGIELKTSYGLTNILIPEHHSMYSDVLDKIRTQVFYINITFE